jgi:F420 biosynthesis protein FbiB-like protein
MSDLIELIHSRRSIRRYMDKSVPAELVERLLTTAAWAPSAHNRQPWRFAILEDSVTRARLAAAMGERLRRDLAADGLDSAAIERDASRAYARISGAPLLILLCLTLADMDSYPDARRRGHELTMAVQSAAMAGQNLLLAAHALGLGACWLCAPLFCPDTVRETLALPPDWQPQGLITAGYPAEAKTKTRAPLETRVWRITNEERASLTH